MQELNLGEIGEPTSVETSFETLSSRSELVAIRLHFEGLAPVQLTMRGPRGFMNRRDGKLSALFLASGFATGQESVRLLGDIPNAVVVGFEYPFNAQDFQKDPESVFQFVRQTPAHIALSLRWLSKQRWLAPQGLVAMGVSLGGVVLPSGLHFAQKLGVEVPSTIFAFTGANLNPILKHNLQEAIPADYLDGIVNLLLNLLTLHDPQLHVGSLQGRFLVLQADADQVIPAESTDRLFDLIQGPKTRVILHGPHINVDQADLILQTQQAVWSWLAQ